MCPHKHIIRLSCQSLLALQEKYITIMDFLCLFYDMTLTGLERERFVSFIANYKCPKAHGAGVKRIISHTPAERACQCVRVADNRVRWTLTVISNPLTCPRVQTPIMMKQNDQNLAFERLFLPKGDASAFWWSGGVFQVSLKRRERKEPVYNSLPHTHTNAQTNTHTRALPSPWLTEAAGASGVKGRGVSPGNKIVVGRGQTTQSIFPLAPDGSSEGWGVPAFGQVFGQKLENNVGLWSLRVKRHTRLPLCMDLRSSSGLKWDVSGLKRSTSD